MEQLRKALSEIGLNTVRDWQKLAKEFIDELETNKTKLLDLEPYYDSWIVNIEHNLISDDIYDPVVISMTKEVFDGFTNIRLDKKEKLIKFDLFGSNYCIGKHNDQMFIKRY